MTEDNVKKWQDFDYSPEHSMASQKIGLLSTGSIILKHNSQ